MFDEPETVLVELHGSDIKNGLSQAEVTNRIKMYGHDVMEAEKLTLKWRRFANQFCSLIMGPFAAAARELKE